MNSHISREFTYYIGKLASVLVAVEVPQTQLKWEQRKEALLRIQSLGQGMNQGRLSQVSRIACFDCRVPNAMLSERDRKR
jgi:hypothetical protein